MTSLDYTTCDFNGCLLLTQYWINTQNTTTPFHFMVKNNIITFCNFIICTNLMWNVQQLNNDLKHIGVVATLLWPSVGVKPNTWKKLGLESSGTPENSEDDLKDQNTSHWGVLGVIGMVLKRKYRKCPRILDLDICSPSYGQKKGRESNWQFDSRPLKVGNRPTPDVRFGSAIRRWKDLDKGYNFGSDLVAIRGRGEELCPLKVPGVQNRDTLCHLDVGVAERRRVYYREYGGGILPSPGCGVSKWVRVPVVCPYTKRTQNGF